MNISIDKDAKYLIWSDIHNRFDLLKLFWEQNKSKIPDISGIILGGDYFDNWCDDANIATKSAVCLKSINKFLGTEIPIIKLLGNHDFSYKYWKTKLPVCSGFTLQKAKAINSILNKKDWDSLYDYVKIGDWVISHAGFISTIYCSPEKKPVWDFRRVNNIIKEGREHAKIGVLKDCYDLAGHLWIRFVVPEYYIKPEHFIIGTKQLFFHTILEAPMAMYLNEEKFESPTIQYLRKDTHLDFEEKINELGVTVYVNMDTNNNYYGILTVTNGKTNLTTHPVKIV